MGQFELRGVIKTMPYIMLFFVGLTTVWAFFGKEVFGGILPFVNTGGGWLIGLVTLSIGTIVLLTLMNAIEEKAHNGAAANDQHH
jgi:hypothetical protein